MSQHLMLLPSLSCPAGCAYCFGPHGNGESMPMATLKAVVRWLNSLDNDKSFEITFHGGEPLVPGIDFYQMALPLLRNGLAAHQVSFGIQSNLWLLTNKLCDLFGEYNVSIGTSLDGPEAINDAQRGEGYFQRTMSGIQLARRHGLSVGCICTFTPQTAPHAREIYDFFAKEGIAFSIHAALPSPAHLQHKWVLPPETHGQLLVDLLRVYLSNLEQVRISTLDVMCRGVSSGHGGICAFRDCLGEYLAIDPLGWIYPCQRFAGMAEFRLGSIYDCPSQDEMIEAPIWQVFQERQKRIDEDCHQCHHLSYCRGGCLYNAWVAGGGSLDRIQRDPHCSAYQRVFRYITDRALEEVFSEKNMRAVVTENSSKHSLLRKGKLLQIMRGGPHPHLVAQQARKVAAAVALAVSQSPEEAVEKLDCAGLVTHRDLAQQSLRTLQSQLRDQTKSLVNAYLHVTYACNLACNHCYASAGPRQTRQILPVEAVASLIRQTAEAGFRKVVITGGEPLEHPQRDALLDTLAALRHTVKPMQIILRTNLVTSLPTAVVKKLVQSADQIVVSVDGNEASHDARRGVGTYARTLANLHSLIPLLPHGNKGGTRIGVVLAATLTAAQMNGAEGEAVRALGKELNLSVRFKPVLPLGRATGIKLAPEFYSSNEDGCEALAHGMRLAATCGLGMNLYIDPEGECFPCYALTSRMHALGNAIDEGLVAVLGRNDAYRRITVDSNRGCRECALRYLCGGACHAWSREVDPDAPTENCTGLQSRSSRLLANALESLEVDLQRWRMAGLPFPEPAKSKPDH